MATLQTAGKSVPHHSLDVPRPHPAKAEVHQSNSVQHVDMVGESFGEIALNALVEYYGTLKELTAAVNETDSSLVRREILQCNFKRLKACDPRAFAKVGKAFEDNFGPMTTPLQRYELLKRRRAAIDCELDQFTESLIA